MDKGQQHAEALRCIRSAVSLFGFDNTWLSFNGGKDSTVLLHLVIEAFPEDYQRLSYVYFSQENEFPEVIRFIEACDVKYNLNVKRVGSSFREELDKLVNENGVKAIFMGTRSGDPYSSKLSAFSLSDAGWPLFMRVNPILEWSYAEVWNYLEGKEYCSLYAEGYTSLGSTTNTERNPMLEDSHGSYRHAKHLAAGKYERHGRGGRRHDNDSSNGDDVRSQSERARRLALVVACGVLGVAVFVGYRLR